MLQKSTINKMNALIQKGNALLGAAPSARSFRNVDPNQGAIYRMLPRGQGHAAGQRMGNNHVGRIMGWR